MKKYLFLLAIALISYALPSQAQTVRKGFVSDIMAAGRVVDCKEITAADLPYSKGQGAPFSIMIVPKSTSNTTEVEIVDGRLYQGNATGPIPLTVNSWNVSAFVALTAANTALFTNYRVFVGFGQTAE